jgi:hypothetical protein
MIRGGLRAARYCLIEEWNPPMKACSRISAETPIAIPATERTETVLMNRECDLLNNCLKAMLKTSLALK